MDSLQFQGNFKKKNLTVVPGKVLTSKRILGRTAKEFVEYYEENYKSNFYGKLWGSSREISRKF